MPGGGFTSVVPPLGIRPLRWSSRRLAVEAFDQIVGWGRVPFGEVNNKIVAMHLDTLHDLASCLNGAHGAFHFPQVRKRASGYFAVLICSLVTVCNLAYSVGNATFGPVPQRDHQ